MATVADTQVKDEERADVERAAEKIEGERAADAATPDDVEVERAAKKAIMERAAEKADMERAAPAANTQEKVERPAAGSQDEVEMATFADIQDQDVERAVAAATQVKARPRSLFGRRRVLLFLLGQPPSSGPLRFVTNREGDPQVEEKFLPAQLL